jgi:hypothetical protein
MSRRILFALILSITLPLYAETRRKLVDTSNRGVQTCLYRGFLRWDAARISLQLLEA